ncbi:helix-turn-helix transcriptional regulator [Paenibacillus glucanolyticus]|uniref:helix-turn-helix domain-containing protein n=1 Tax=Paenibacillus glucanolyticus TaxID=59843 RepID=UPI0030CF3F7B
MTYASFLKKSIDEADLSLGQICRRLKQKGINLDRTTLSKLQNGKMAPAKDPVNIALAEVLGVNAEKLRLAAIKEIIPPDLYSLIRKVG